MSTEIYQLHPWFKFPRVIDHLKTFGRAIQGYDPFEVHLEEDSTKCRSGYCSFGNQRIVVNPKYFNVTPEKQYVLTKCLLVHEAAHRRYSQPIAKNTATADIYNILEDERIERLMCRDFLGLRWLIQRLSEALYFLSSPIDESSDNPEEIVIYFLHLRWARQLNQETKGNLSAKNRALWKQIQPMVYDAWQAESSSKVRLYAHEIADILKVSQLNMFPSGKEALCI